MTSIFAIVVVALAAGLVGVPASWAATQPRRVPIGVVVRASLANGHIDGELEGMAVFDGDVFPVALDRARDMVLQIVSNHLMLSSDSSVLVHGLPGGFSVELRRGFIGIRTGARQTFRVLSNGIMIQPLGPTPAWAEITRATATKVQLKIMRSSLKASLGEQIEILDEGHSYVLDLRSDNATHPVGSNSKPPAAGHNGFTKTMMVVIPALSGVAVWLAVMSPCKPE